MVGYYIVHTLLKVGQHQLESTASTVHKLPADMQIVTFFQIFDNFERRYLNNDNVFSHQIIDADTATHGQEIDMMRLRLRSVSSEINWAKIQPY
jgi:hypothetical protein